MLSALLYTTLGWGVQYIYTKRIDAVPYAINFDFSLEAVCSLTECSRSTVMLQCKKVCKCFFFCSFEQGISSREKKKKKTGSVMTFLILQYLLSVLRVELCMLYTHIYMKSRKSIDVDRHIARNHVITCS